MHAKNHALAEERRRKRNELLDATEQDLKDIQKRVVREKKPLRGVGAIGRAVGKVIGRRKVAKHFNPTEWGLSLKKKASRHCCSSTPC